MIKTPKMWTTDERVKDADGCFFENFTALSWKQENRKLQAEREDESEKGRPLPIEADVGITPIEFKLAKKECEQLYVEVLYTIKHKLGASSGNYDAYAGDLYDYAQEAFGMSSDNHRRLLAVAQEEKPPIPVLNVVVVEARDLEAKDSDGYSDPYCMLGIQPGDATEARRNSSDEETKHGGSNPSPKRQGLKKLGASLKLRDRSPSKTSPDSLPAKFIRTTTVKQNTLNPVWNEKFSFDIEDLHTDKLHLDIWDHDDESSVFDAARKLNEVSGLKGLSRYFKQIAQSARSSGDNVDDFLGCVSVSIEDIPSYGIDQWFPLQGRSLRSTVQGEIHLKLTLGTREDRGLAADEDNWKEVAEHQELLSLFIDYELNHHQGPTSDWAGDLPNTALTILHQHALQGDITELQQAICRWTTYSRKHMKVSLDYALLHQLLDDINATWGGSGNPLSRDEEAALADSFNLFIDYCLGLIRKHRDLFPAANQMAQYKLSHLLKCLLLLCGMEAYRWCCPFRHQLHTEIINTLKKGTLEWYNTARGQVMFQTRQAVFHSSTNLMNILNTDLNRGFIHYHPIFESEVDVNYSSVVYKQLEKLVADDVTKQVQTEAKKIIGCEFQESGDCSPPPEGSAGVSSEDIIVVVFELYLAFQEFFNFREKLPLEDRKHLVIEKYHIWFTDSVHNWLDLASRKLQQRIKKAKDLDKTISVNSSIKHSTSALDTTKCFVQIKDFLNQLNWPEVTQTFPFILKALEVIGNGATFYAKLSHHKLLDLGLCDEQQSHDLTEQVCIVMNDVEHVRTAVSPLVAELGVEEVLITLEQREGERSAAQSRAAVSGLIQKTDETIETDLLDIAAAVAEKMCPQLKRSVFHLAWAPEKLDAERALAPLLEYLDSNLKRYYKSTYRTNFDRVLVSIWKSVLQEITVTVQGNAGEKMAFYDRLISALRILVEFFHAGSKGIHDEMLRGPDYQALERLLKLNTNETSDLIEEYIAERIKEQKRLRQGEFGILTVKTLFNSPSDSLSVDVVEARNLTPLDPTGFSDPFVIIELLPRHKFPDCPRQMTKVQKRTLNPFFDESFEFTVTAERCRQEGAAICFTVMDHDVVTKNDFEGEAYLSLTTIPGLEERAQDHVAVNLVLMQPNDKSDILNALEFRTWDKLAQDFVKEQRSKRP
ncbi:BAI1-associated protein 3-like isoform X2 [Tachypleus tridentatus]|uniref:BAI1-associated protein 3-like isoform X2 n=2 Tax=Tachypleus tridentatus TaxID=6853 RepID=UPI003FD3948B